jgi:hypothetical protein
MKSTFNLYLNIGFHTAIIICNQKNYKCTYVDGACPIIVNEIFKGKIYNVVHDKNHSNSYRKNCTFFILVLIGKIKA